MIERRYLSLNPRKILNIRLGPHPRILVIALFNPGGPGVGGVREAKTQRKWLRLLAGPTDDSSLFTAESSFSMVASGVSSLTTNSRSTSLTLFENSPRAKLPNRMMERSLSPHIPDDARIACSK